MTRRRSAARAGAALAAPHGLDSRADLRDVEFELGRPAMPRLPRLLVRGDNAGLHEPIQRRVRDAQLGGNDLRRDQRFLRFLPAHKTTIPQALQSGMIDRRPARPLDRARGERAMGIWQTEKDNR